MKLELKKYSADCLRCHKFLFTSYIVLNYAPNHIVNHIICSANQWIGFYMMTASLMKELNSFSCSVTCSFKILKIPLVINNYSFLNFRLWHTESKRNLCLFLPQIQLENATECWSFVREHKIPFMFPLLEYHSLVRFSPIT